MTTTPQTLTPDPHITDLLHQAEEAGMQKAWLISGVSKPHHFTPVPLNGKPIYHLTGQLDPDSGGMLLLLYFPHGDDRPAGIEEL